MLKGGVENNVIPSELRATFDMRVATADLDELEQKINRWCEEAGGNITMNTIERGIKEVPTRMDDSNPFWLALKSGVEESGLDVVPTIMPAATDMRFLREMNISAIGFAPLMETEMRAHNHNEYLNADIYLEGIEVYTKILPRLGNL